MVARYTSDVSTEFLLKELVPTGPSGDNATLPILGLRHSLWPEWKHGINWLTSGSKDPTAEVTE